MRAIGTLLKGIAIGVGAAIGAALALVVGIAVLALPGIVAAIPFAAFGLVFWALYKLLT